MGQSQPKSKEKLKESTNSRIIAAQDLRHVTSALRGSAHCKIVLLHDVSKYASKSLMTTLTFVTSRLACHGTFRSARTSHTRRLRLPCDACGTDGVDTGKIADRLRRASNKAIAHSRRSAGWIGGRWRALLLSGCMLANGVIVRSTLPAT